jgi:hypothetical protein
VGFMYSPDANELDLELQKQPAAKIDLIAKS